MQCPNCRAEDLVKNGRIHNGKQKFSTPVIRWLHACALAFVMPVIIQGKEHSTRALLQLRRTYKTRYTMQSPLYGQRHLRDLGCGHVLAGEIWAARGRVPGLCGFPRPSSVAGPPG